MDKRATEVRRNGFWLGFYYSPICVNISMYLVSPWNNYSFNRSLKVPGLSWELVAHTHNPSYSGGRDQEDHGSKPAWANSFWDCILKNLVIKKGLWSGSRCRSCIQASISQKRKKNPRSLRRATSRVLWF
jgi:hypothetical protein